MSDKATAGGTIVPVCCAAPLSAALMNDFLTADKRGMDVQEGYVAFVDSNKKLYKSGTVELVEDDSSPTSPFINKTPRECYEMLKEMRAAGSDFKDGLFAILDERSQQDRTATLVDAVEDFAAVRAVFDDAMSTLMAVEAGSISIDECADHAEQAKDNVLRYSLSGKSTPLRNRPKDAQDIKFPARAS